MAALERLDVAGIRGIAEFLATAGIRVAAGIRGIQRNQVTRGTAQLVDILVTAEVHQASRGIVPQVDIPGTAVLAVDRDTRDTRDFQGNLGTAGFLP